MSAMPPLLSVEALRIETAGREAAERAPLLENLTFDVAPDEFVALVGESGSGKTMAARAILGLLPRGVQRVSGNIRFGDRELTTLSSSGLRAIRGNDIGMVFQEPMSSLNPALTIGTQLREGLDLHRKLPDYECRKRCIEMLERVRIKDAERCLNAYPHEFSGGMRQRIMLASVMLLAPSLLIADEPTTALDTLNQREVMELMADLARAGGASVLLITHDLGLVARYARRMIVLEKGRLVESGKTEQVLHAPEHPYTKRLVASLAGAAKLRQTVQGQSPVVLAAENVSIAYPGRRGLLLAGKPKRVVDNVSIEVRAGETLALVGGSGSGKTSLGRAVLGLTPVSGGCVRFDGVDLAAMNSAQRKSFRRAAQLVFQDPFSSLDPRMRIGDIVGAALRHVPGIGRAERRSRVLAVLEDVGLPDFERRFPHQMSGGQRQRVAIARAIVSRPRLMVADEPVSALDATIQRQVLELFQKLQHQYGFACLFITHDLAVVAQLSDRVAVMCAGALVETGATEAVLSNPQHPYTKALLAATPAFSAIALAS